jgi:hypothetical protein
MATVTALLLQMLAMHIKNGSHYMLKKYIGTKKLFIFASALITYHPLNMLSLFRCW